jgi:hypothetical protein
MSHYEMLSDAQLQALAAALKKYGIESPDLLAELTDHHAGLIESKMAAGQTFEDGLHAFKSENSWLKLRKLEFEHVRIQTKSFTRYLVLFLREMFIGPRFWVAYPIIGFLYYCIGLPTSAGGPVFYFIQGCSIGTGVAILFFILAKRRSKFKQFGPLISMSLMLLYLSAYLPAAALVPGHHLVFTGFALSALANLGFYTFWVFLLIFTGRYFIKLRRDTQEFSEIFSKEPQ